MTPVKEYPHAYDGTPTVNILAEAYQDGNFPNPLDVGELEQNIAFQRVRSIPFAAYWSNIFRRFQDSAGCPAGPFAEKIFEIASTDIADNEITELTAETLGKHFGESVLEAGIDDPDLADYSLTTWEWPKAANFLFSCRDSLEGESNSAQRAISDSWIKFVALLEGTDKKTYDSLLIDLIKANNLSRSHTYGSSNRRQQQIITSCALAGVLGRYFPTVVLSQLVDPLQTASVEAEPAS